MTIELSDGLLHAAKQAAAERGTTLKAVVELALRQHDHGVAEPWTADRDFSRFAGLRFRNPLVAAG